MDTTERAQQLVGWAITLLAICLAAVTFWEGYAFASVMMLTAAILACPLIWDHLELAEMLKQRGTKREVWAIMAMLTGWLASGTSITAPSATDPVLASGGSSLSTSKDPASVADRIEDGAIARYGPKNRSDYQKLFAKLGERVYEVEALAQQAAEISLRTNKCDRVVNADVSEKSTQAALSFYVDCANRTRVRMTEVEIRNGAATNVETEEQRVARMSSDMAEDQRLIGQAKTNVRRHLRDPASAKFGPIVISRKKGVAACGTVNATNAFGGRIGEQAFINTQSDGIFLAEMRSDFPALWKRYCG